MLDTHGESMEWIKVGKDIDACVEGLPALVTVTRQNLPRL
jgi:hypothetical protein